jgi:hypothetical protein
MAFYSSSSKYFQYWSLVVSNSAAVILMTAFPGYPLTQNWSDWKPELTDNKIVKTIVDIPNADPDYDYWEELKNSTVSLPKNMRTFYGYLLLIVFFILLIYELAYLYYSFFPRRK